jgi:GT2 family glycosyltransferase
MTLAPIPLFTYNRPYHTRKTVAALQKNKLSADSDLIVFSDGPKEGSSGEQIQLVRNYLKTIQHFNSIRIIERESNYGLSANILDGVTQIISQYGKVVVLEDDLVTSPFFLDFINEGLRLYENDENVISMHGYLLPVKEALPGTFSSEAQTVWVGPPGKRLGNIPAGCEPAAKKAVESNQCEEFDFDGSYPYVQMLKDQIAGKTSSGLSDGMHLRFWKINIPFIPENHLYQT